MSATVLFILLILPLLPDGAFKSAQLKYSRVKAAYLEKENDLNSILKKNGIKRESLEVFIRVFKNEQVVELWAKNKCDTQFVHLKYYAICASSGSLGPKRKQGDSQVPEGFYIINQLNPASNFHLSLGINYPNQSDRNLSRYTQLGGSICIHGNCVTIGCIPITDDKIKELYIFALEAKNGGQDEIQVHIFPARLIDSRFLELKETFKSDSSLIAFWKNLKEGFEFFEKHRRVPRVSVQKNGKYVFEEVLF
jgi:murein L,D-transpeptidase YafK